MPEEKHHDECCGKEKWHHGHHAGHHGAKVGGGFYFVAFIGAAVYYIQHSAGFWMGVLGFLKALVWPAMLIHKVFTLIGM